MPQASAEGDGVEATGLVGSEAACAGGSVVGGHIERLITIYDLFVRTASGRPIRPPA